MSAIDHNATWRNTSQYLMPLQHSPTAVGQYDIYPGFPIGGGKIANGYVALARYLAGQNRVVIDGYGGVFWENLRGRLDSSLLNQGVQATWMDVRTALRSENGIDALVAPFLGGDDPLFGTRFTGQLTDFFDSTALRSLYPDPVSDITILYGCGAALAGWDNAFLVYVDVPKNEIQFRARAGSIANLGCSEPAPPKAMYKRFFFVDWVALNRHKADLLPDIDLIVDEQRPDQPALMTGDDLREGLSEMSRNYFRVRPWFEPGAWGGQWMKDHIPQLPQDVPNYAWSFELIVPENGLLFESDGHLLEVSFDFLMLHAHEAILGECAPRFGQEFPIRFDFLDTFDGGNLSVQCHPRPDYIKSHFGENFTQDETYYILDCKPGARVYLGFQKDIVPAEFREALDRSAETGADVAIERFVNVEPADKHDLFLIPHGTIHCSGENNLVLEISATPYIFTFKMYDWLRLDLDGKPRPLNIARAFENLYFDRKGDRIRNEFKAQPRVLAEGENWRWIHLPTHAEHFYDVHRLEFTGTVDVQTDGVCHVMSLVEGQSIILKTANGRQQRFNYAETFVVPAAAGHYTLTNEGRGKAKVVKAFVKPQSKETG